MDCLSYSPEIWPELAKESADKLLSRLFSSLTGDCKWLFCCLGDCNCCWCSFCLYNIWLNLASSWLSNCNDKYIQIVSLQNWLCYGLCTMYFMLGQPQHKFPNIIPAMFSSNYYSPCNSRDDQNVKCVLTEDAEWCQTLT